MFHRSYPVRRKGQSNSSPVTSIRFSTSAKQGLKEIRSMLQQRWHLPKEPSLSLLLEGVIIRWAESVKDDPNAITDLITEIEARGGVKGAKNQFQLDREIFKKEGLV